MEEPLICLSCDHIGMPVKKTRGSGKMEKFLWVTFLFPGIFYTVWRRAGRRQVCRKCGADNLISTDTALGRKLVEKQMKTNLKNGQSR